MKLLLKWLLIAIGHIAVLFALYGTGVLGLASIPAISRILVPVLWPVVPSLLAFVLYYVSSARSDVWRPGLLKEAVFIVCSLMATILSGFCGVFASFNTFGT
jgi:hypothetical protein